MYVGKRVQICRLAVLKSLTCTCDFLYNLYGDGNNEGTIKLLWASCKFRIEFTNMSL